MADPVIAGGVRLQIVYEADSGLPEDVFTNSLAFIRPAGDTLVDFAADVAALWRSEFLSAVGAGTSVASYMGKQLSGDILYKFYDLSLPAPRFPLIIPGDMPPFSTAQQEPSEVALCVSLVAGQNLPRQRGRIYVGPWAQSAGVNGRPGTGVITALAQGMEDFRTAVEGSLLGRSLTVLSQADGEMNIVTGGWVDNSWDTQRRRGEASTARTQFGTYVG